MRMRGLLLDSSTLRDTGLKTAEITLRDGNISVPDWILTVAIREATAAAWFF
jgi:hypothetical protein